uniref:phosphoenolpyruvate-utilizing N-terminal domain-containing protein n=1 Tax=Staphylococcus pettenkoferi TaxID=170573 RepID=UPI0030B8D754
MGIGRGYLVVEAELSFGRDKVGDVDGEMKKFGNGMDTCKVELSKIGNKGEDNIGGDKGGIFDGDLVIVEEGEIIKRVEEKIS